MGRDKDERKKQSQELNRLVRRFGRRVSTIVTNLSRFRSDRPKQLSENSAFP